MISIALEEISIILIILYSIAYQSLSKLDLTQVMKINPILYEYNSLPFANCLIRISNKARFFILQDITRKPDLIIFM